MVADVVFLWYSLSKPSISMVVPDQSYIAESNTSCPHRKPSKKAKRQSVRNIRNVAQRVYEKNSRAYPPISIIGRFFICFSSPMPACLAFLRLTAIPIRSRSSRSL